MSLCDFTPPPGRAARRPRRGLRQAFGAVILLATVARLALAIAAPTQADADAAVYDRLARNVVAGHGLARGVARPRPSAAHPPAWPLLLAASYAVTHRMRDTSALTPARAREVDRARWRVGRVVNALLASAIVALIGLIAIELWGVTGGVAAAAVAAVYPPIPVLGLALFSEPLFVALELAGALALLRHRRAPHRRWLPVVGLCAGLAMLTRANGAALLLPFALGAWRGSPRWSWRALAAPAAVVAVALTTVTPWVVRNAIVMHAFVPGATDLGRTLRGTYNPIAAHDGYGWSSRLPAADRRVMEGGEARKSAALTRLALTYVRRHPAAVLQAGATNTARILDLSSRGRAGLARRLDSAVLRDLSMAGFAVMAPLALLGAFTSRARRMPRWLWLMPLVMWLGAIPFGVNFSRFRAPLEPFIVLLATAGVALIVEALVRERRAPR